MGINSRRFVLSFAALALMLVPFSVGAVTVLLEVMIDGQSAGSFDETDLRCMGNGAMPPARVEHANCAGQGIELGGSNGFRLDSWNLFLDEDPVISAVTAFTNLSPFTQQLTLVFTMPIVPAIPGGTLIGGSIQGGATDNNGNGVTLSVALGSALYTAIIDGNDEQSLYSASNSWTAGSFLSVSVPAASFGTPIPNQPAPAALSSIGIRLDFLLTGNDSASITSNFVVMPVPVPAAAWLFGSALGMLVWVRRRRVG